MDTPTPFAKLFDTDEGQLLVTLVETENEEPGMEMRAASVSGITAKMTFAYDDETQQLKAFAGVDHAGANEAARTLRNAIRNLVRPA